MPALVMHCSSLFAPFLAYVVPSFYPIFYCILCSVPCLRLCLRKVAQVSLSAAEHPGHLDRWKRVLLLVRKDCANVKFTACFNKTHPFTENTLSFPVQIENLTLAKSSCVRVKVLPSSDQYYITSRRHGRQFLLQTKPDMPKPN